MTKLKRTGFTLGLYCYSNTTIQRNPKSPVTAIRTVRRLTGLGPKESNLNEIIWIERKLKAPSYPGIGLSISQMVNGIKLNTYEPVPENIVSEVLW